MIHKKSKINKKVSLNIYVHAPQLQQKRTAKYKHRYLNPLDFLTIAFYKQFKSQQTYTFFKKKRKKKRKKLNINQMVITVSRVKVREISDQFEKVAMNKNNF